MVLAQEEESHLQKMLDAGVIEPSISEWASPPVLIRERDGKVRWCIDYLKLNSVTKNDIYPLPLIDECIATLSGNEWFSKLDSSLLLHVSIDIICSAKEVFIAVETGDWYFSSSEQIRVRWRKKSLLVARLLRRYGGIKRCSSWMEKIFCGIFPRSR